MLQGDIWEPIPKDLVSLGFDLRRDGRTDDINSLGVDPNCNEYASPAFSRLYRKREGHRLATPICLGLA